MSFAMYKASFEWTCWFQIKDRNSIMNDCKTITFVFCKARRLTTWRKKPFNATIYIRPSIQNQKLYTFIASMYI